MGLILHVLSLLILAAVCLVGSASLLFGLPGTFVILAAGLVYAWATGFAALGWSTLGWLTALAVGGEVIELLSAGAAGAADSRPSRRVTIGALAGGIVGGLVGTPLLFGIGSLLGALAGAFTGAAFAVMSEGGSVDNALATGLAALRGRLFGFVAKAGIAVAMTLITIVAAAR